MIQDSQQIEQLRATVERLQKAVSALQESPQLGLWDWLTRAGFVIAIFLAALRIREHFTNLARIRITSKSEGFCVRYMDTDDAYKEWRSAPVEAATNTQARTDVMIRLEVRNIGRAATTLRAATLKTSHTVLGTQDMNLVANDNALSSVGPVRIEPGGVVEVILRTQLNDALLERSIAGNLYLKFTNQETNLAVTLIKGQPC